MKALVKLPQRNFPQVPLTLTEVPAPTGDVIVDVLVVGICRTDSRVVSGEIPVEQPIIVGHEFAGVIAEGPRAGTRVAGNPMICEKFMGLAIDGALAEQVAMPAENLFEIPDNVSDEIAAYLEPVAASLAPAYAGITKEMAGAVVGGGRIAKLTLLILQTEGYLVEQMQEGTTYDYVIETGQADLAPALEALRPKGLLIVKSRGKTATVPLGVMVQKELRAQAVAYAPYEKAVEWLVNNAEKMVPFIGKTYPFEQFLDAFAEAAQTEAVKTFIRVA